MRQVWKQGKIICDKTIFDRKKVYRDNAEITRKLQAAEAVLVGARDAALEEAARHIDTAVWSGTGDDFAARIRALIGRKPAPVPTEEK